MVVSILDFKHADKISVCNKATQRKLQKNGVTNIKVIRLAVDVW